MMAEIDEAGYWRLLNEAQRKLGPCSDPTTS